MSCIYRPSLRLLLTVTTHLKLSQIEIMTGHAETAAAVARVPTLGAKSLLSGFFCDFKAAKMEGGF